MTALIECARPPSGHWAGKQRRRRAIIEAARKIIASDGEDGLTMRRLAVAAGVSPTTPYNLFGSKEAIIRAVFDDDFAINFKNRAGREPGETPFARLFAIIDISFAAFRRRPVFYKALFRTLLGARESEVRSSEWLRASIINALVAEAIDGGYLDPEFAELIAVTIARIFRAAVLEWVTGELAVEKARREVGLGVALFLAASVRDPHRGELLRLRDRYAAASRPS
jgi:AcrR family transcriptional regulator